MLTFLVFFLILSVLILIHELGHFIAAKRSDVYVEEFGFGLPPRVVGKRIGETLYSLNLLPFGGFVKLAGEEGIDEDDELFPRSFASKATWKRSVILVAGVSMNLLLALVLYWVFFMFNDYKSLTIPMYFDNYSFRFGREESISTVITGFMEDSPASEVGLRTGEAILEIDGVAVYNVPDVQRELSTKAGQEVKLLVMDITTPDKMLRTVTVTPDESEDGRGIIGVFLTRAVTLNYQSEKGSAPLKHSYNILGYTFFTFGQLIDLSVETKSVEPVSVGVAGPVGIFTVVGSIVETGGRQAVLGLLDLTALLSVSLALLNILPLPALDGGRLVFVIWEMITGRKVNQKLEGNLHKVGLLLFMVLIILVTIKDVRTFIF